MKTTKAKARRPGPILAGDYTVLAMIRDDPAASVADIAEALNHPDHDGASDRIAKLVERGFLDTTPDGYRLTRAGALAAWRFCNELADGLLARAVRAEAIAREAVGWVKDLGGMPHAGGKKK